MNSLKTNTKFANHLQNLVEEFHKSLKDAGFDVKLSSLNFHPISNDLVCPCGTQWVLNPITNKLEPRCKRCPQNPSVDVNIP